MRLSVISTARLLPAILLAAFIAAATFSPTSAPAATPAAPATLPPRVTRVPVVFTGGFDTDPQDRGRPVNLIAAALGVPTEVFREAFSHVKPARAGTAPEPEQVQKNKSALMAALGKHGITNDRLDEVSNHYRYRRERDEVWKHREAKANALVKDGKVTAYEITDAGAGYSSPPTVTVPDVKAAAPKVELAFGKDLEKNGSVVALKAGQ
ncbi:MAG: hypothetical protein ACAI34_16850 [Verrucomicrobium sp.]